MSIGHYFLSKWYVISRLQSLKYDRRQNQSGQQELASVWNDCLEKFD